ncbi:MAG: transglutaminase domain-containing protein [Odoribacter splanchnicus]|nr:transglutaminase domain-containing protein [Odoribacter splanchnicus]
MKYLFYLLFIFSATACMDLSPNVESTLKIAGKNKKELIKVLQHYKNKQADSLKYKAACFLIEHMKWHKRQIIRIDPRFHDAYADIDARFRSVSEGLSLKELGSKEARYVFSRKEKLTKPLFDSSFTETQATPTNIDAQSIDAAFLIDHIENAFRLKATSAYTSDLSFDDFCNYVLPYRSCEYGWFDNGKTLNEMFSPYLNNPTAKTLNDHLGWYNTYVFRMKCLYGKCPIKKTTGIYDLFFYRKHNCTGVASHAANIMRACGLPTAVDFNTAHRDFQSIHYHCSILDKNGKWLAFNPETEVIGDFNFKYYHATNIIRFMYAAQEDSPYMLKNKDEKLPPLFGSPCIKEVTACTKPVYQVTLPFGENTENKLAYLYVFHSGEDGITPATWGVIDHQNKVVKFDHVLTKILYFPVYLTKQKTQYFSSPFWITEDKTQQGGFRLHFLQELTDTVNDKTSLVFTRKFPRKVNMLKIAQEMVGGQFFGANQKDFSDQKLLYTISQVPSPYLQEFKISQPAAYKYYRYTAPKEHPHTNVSILEFLTDTRHSYKNTAPPTPLPVLYPTQPIQQERYEKLLDTTIEVMKKAPYYDGNMLTSSGSRQSITLNLKTRQIVNAIRFAPLNANNSIHIGDHYELRYWDNGWKRGDVQKARHNCVEFKNIPSNRLYWLKNIYRGKEELPFIVKNGKQQFIYYDVLK